MASPEPFTSPETEPEYFSTSEPRSEPEWYSTAEPEWRSTAEPEYFSTGEPVSEPELFSSAEPSAEWFSTAETGLFSTGEPSAEPEFLSTAEPSGEPEWFSTAEPELFTTGEPEPGLFSTAEPSSEPEFYSTLKPEPELFSSAEPEWFSTAEPRTEPEWFSTSEPRSEPEYASTGEPEFYSSAEPELFSSAEPEFYPTGEPESERLPSAEPGLSFAEPVPDWEIAKPMYQAAWEFHVYAIAILFTLLAIAALINIIRLSRQKKLRSRGYFISLNVMMLLLGVARAVYFYVDGYNSNNTFPQAVAYFFISIAFPCLTAAFYILFSALLRSLRVRYMSPKIFSTAALIGIITFNFILSLLTDFIVGYFFETRFLILFCQIVYTLWGVTFSVSYIVLFVRLYKATEKRNRDIMRMDSVYKSRDLNSSGSSYSSQASISSQTSIVPRISKMALSVKITLIVCVFFICITFLNIVNMASEMGIMTDKVPEPWSWWIYNFVYRLCEFGMGATIVYVGHLPFRTHEEEGSQAKAAPDEGRYKKYSNV